MSRDLKVWKIALILVCLAILFCLPFILNRYLMYLANLAGMFIILAIGLNLVMGYAGQISLGHVAFAAIGAYTVGLLRMKLGVPFWIGWPVGAIFAALVGFAVGLPALRLRGHYLALATIGFGISTQLIIFRWDSLTNGPRGFDMTPVRFFSMEISSGYQVYYLITATVLLLIVLARNIIKSKVGRAFLAIRDSEIAAQAMGVNLAKYKTLAFTLSAFYAGTMGGLYAALMQYISADNFGLLDSVACVTMIVIGGMASLPGSIIGVLLVTVTQELFRGTKEYQGLIYGVAVVVFIIFMPRGVYGLWSDLKLKIKTAWSSTNQIGI
jgi:branched-chain amino acid transport system permease protein